MPARRLRQSPLRRQRRLRELPSTRMSLRRPPSGSWSAETPEPGASSARCAPFVARAAGGLARHLGATRS
eukprot:8349215-Alexandrium_andersonii.AAC.1